MSTTFTDSQYGHFLGWQLVLAVIHWAAAFGLAGYAQAEGKDWTTRVNVRYNAWASQNGTSCAEGDACIIYSVQEEVGEDISLIWSVSLFLCSPSIPPLTKSIGEGPQPAPR